YTTLFRSVGVFEGDGDECALIGEAGEECAGAGKNFFVGGGGLLDGLIFGDDPEFFGRGLGGNGRMRRVRCRSRARCFGLGGGRVSRDGAASERCGDQRQKNEDEDSSEFHVWLLPGVTLRPMTRRRRSIFRQHWRRP